MADVRVDLRARIGPPPRCPIARLAGVFLLAAAVVCLRPACPASAASRFLSRYEPPTASAELADAIRAIERSLEQGAFDDAAEVIESVLDERLDELLATDDGRLISPDIWLATLSPRMRGPLAGAWRKRHEQSARAALDDLRRNPSARAEAFYAMGRRYALAESAAAAWVEGADRAAACGDAEAAATLYALAAAHGWQPDENRRELWAVCALVSGKAATVSAPVAPAGHKDLAARVSGYRGSVPCDAAWWGRLELVAVSRFIPAAADGLVLMSGPSHVFALREGGQLVWRWSADPPGAFEKAAGRGHGPVYRPAVYAGAAGPQIAIVRQPRAGAADFCLRAFRCADGALMWSSDARPATSRLSMAGNPAICGRHVYCTAVDFAEDPAELVLVSLDLVDGSLIFRCRLGPLFDMRGARQQPPGWDDFWDQSEPAAWGDMVYLTPNTGVAYAVGRFDGRLRWMACYGPAETRAELARRGVAVRVPAGRGATITPSAPAPTDAVRLLRWTAAPQPCGNVLVIAPQDEPVLAGLDLNSGRFAWLDLSPPPAALIGRIHDMAVLAGSAVAAVGASDGKVRWRYEPPPSAAIAGPPAVFDRYVFVPLTDYRVVALAADTGRPSQHTIRVPSYRQLASSDAGRRALHELGAAGPSRR